MESTMTQRKTLSASERVSLVDFIRKNSRYGMASSKDVVLAEMCKKELGIDCNAPAISRLRHALKIKPHKIKKTSKLCAKKTKQPDELVPLMKEMISELKLFNANFKR